MDLIELAASIAAILASFAILRAIRRPRVEGRPLDLRVALLFLVIPVAMGVRFTAGFVAEPSGGMLIMALAGWGLTLWILVLTIRVFRDGRGPRAPDLHSVSTIRGESGRRVRVLLGFAVAGLVGVGAASLNSWEESGVTTAWLVAGVLTLIVWAFAVLFLWVLVVRKTDGA
jgi:hypothetical protein